MFPGLARGRSGDAGAQIERVAEFLLGDPGGQDLLAVPVAAQGVHDLGELSRPQVLQVADQQALDPVLRVARQLRSALDLRLATAADL